MKNVFNSHVYLHKAIRMRDANLARKLIDMGVDANHADDQGIIKFM